MKRYEDEELQPMCGNCALCVHTYRGCECSLTDKIVEYTQSSCQSFLPII